MSFVSKSDEYEMTMTALRMLPEKNQKFAMVKNKLLEEESKRIMKRNIMKQEFESATVTAFSSHRNDQRSNWKRKEDGFPYNCYNYGMRGHKRSNCRKPTKYNGNYHHSGNNYSGQRFHEVNMTERNPNQDGEMEQPRWRNGKRSANYMGKTSSEGGETNL
jgi:hypothetical protein